MAAKKVDPTADFRGTVIASDDLLDTPPGTPQGEQASGEPEAPPPEPPVPPLEEELANVQVASSPVPAGVWEVRVRTTISWSAIHGSSQMITLNPGDRISDALYGPDSVTRMKAAGVPMELVE